MGDVMKKGLFLALFLSLLMVPAVYGGDSYKISVPYTASGYLGGNDYSLNNGTYYDLYYFTLTSQQKVTINLTSNDFDTYLHLLNTNTDYYVRDDDGGAGSNSKLSVTLSAGTYFVAPNSYYGGETGAYVLDINSMSGIPISLESKPFGEVDSNEMLQRYRNNRNLYLNNPEYTNPSAYADMIRFYDWLTRDNSLEGIVNGFYIVGWDLAYEMLSNFLNGGGDSYTIDLEKLFEDIPHLERQTFDFIKNHISSGRKYGTITIAQQSWSNLNYQYAFGALLLEWETNGTEIVFYINNPYSFNIIEARPTNSLYFEAATKVINGDASDFYMVCRLKKPISWIYQ